MKSCLPLAAAVFCVILGCSKPDAPADESTPERTLVPADYTVITSRNDSFGALRFDADQNGMSAAGSEGILTGPDQPTLLYRTREEISYFIGELPCGTHVGRYRSTDGSLLTLPVMEGLDPCLNEVTAMAHTETAVYLALRSTEGGEKPAYLIRKIPWEGGSPVDLPLEELALDIEIFGNRLMVLTLDELETQTNRLRAFGAENLEPGSGMDLDTDARMLGRVGSNGLLVSYPDMHLILDAATLALRETIRYQEGVRPGFCQQDPLSDPYGRLLYYPFEVTSGPESGTSIAALYDIARRTAVLYYFSNFLDPVQRESTFDVGTATAIGYDAANGLLLVGYEKGSVPGRGGLLRLQTEPELRLLDHTELPGVPRAVFSE